MGNNEFFGFDVAGYGEFFGGGGGADADVTPIKIWLVSDWYVLPLSIEGLFLL